MTTSTSRLEEGQRMRSDYYIDYFLLFSFGVVTLASVLLDASVNNDFDQIRNEIFRAQYFGERSRFYNTTAEAHHQKELSYANLGHALQNESLELHQKALTENYYATVVEYKKLMSLLMAEEESEEYQDHMKNSVESLEASNEHLYHGLVLEREAEWYIQKFEEQQRDLYFCRFQVRSMPICEILGGTAMVGRAVELYKWGSKNVTQGIRERNWATHEFEAAQEALQEEALDIRLAFIYDVVESELLYIAEQDEEDAIEEWEDANQTLAEASIEMEQAEHGEAFAREASIKRDEAIHNRKLLESRYIPLHAFFAVEMGLFAMLLFIARCNRSSIIGVICFHRRFQDNLPPSMRQNVISCALCHIMIFVLVVGIMKDSLLHIHDYNTRGRGEIIFAFAFCAAIIETVQFSFLPFFYNATSFIGRESFYSINKDSLQRMMIILSIFVIQLLTLVYTYCVQLLIILVVFGQTSYLFNVINFMGNWSPLALIALILVALHRFISPFAFEIPSESSIRAGELQLLYDKSDSVYSVFSFNENSERSSKYSTVTLSDMEGNKLSESAREIPSKNKNGEAEEETIPGWSDTCSSITCSLPLRRTVSDSVEQNELTWLKEELYILSFSFQLLLLSCLFAVIIKCISYVGVYSRCALLLIFVFLTAAELYCGSRRK